MPRHTLSPTMLWINIIARLIFFAFGLRAVLLSPRFGGEQKPKKRTSNTCHLAVFLGSGGHTSECLALVSSLDFDRYNRRTYFVSDGDNLSIDRARGLEAEKANESQLKGKVPSKSDVTFIRIPRARRVHQSLVTTPFTAFRSLLTCIRLICLRPLITREAVSDVLIVNGPGTCVMLCAAVYLGRILMIPVPITVYVESFARVKSLSLSGNLLWPYVDRFIVQWEDLLTENGRGEYHGWLV